MWDGSNIDGATRALVTGAAGFIGCHLVDALASAGAAITGLDNERSGDWSRVTAPCRRVERDLADLSTDELADLCRDVDVVFHLAAENHNSAKATPRRITDVNVSATRRLFDAAGRAGCSKVVFTWSLYAYGSLGPDPMYEGDAPRPNSKFDVMMKKLRRFVGDDTKIAVEFCDVIPLSETGKRSPVVATVQEDVQSLSVAAPRADVP
jgi:nucleoside-diphosphate-sugar epimerase